MASEKPSFSVSDFIALTNQTLEFAYPSVEVTGEVASFKVNQGKFVFFDLKDDGGSIGCFMTVWQMRLPIEDGMKVTITATPKLTNWGKFSLTVQAVRPVGEGHLRKSFELLKAKLLAEGLFSPERKRPLPYLPKKIAVISSTQAAGYGDFITILNERFGGIKIEVAHVQVQGASAADQMIRAITYFNEQEELADVLVLVRGGGSADDLSSYNDEHLVRTVSSSRIPTLTGIGHEIDTSLSDLAADVRAATPSNAAQILVPDRRELVAEVRGMTLGTISVMERAVEKIEESILAFVDNASLAVDARLAHTEEERQALARIVRQFDPSEVLKKGYAIIRGTVVVGKAIEIERYNEVIEAEVKNVKKR